MGTGLIVPQYLLSIPVSPVHRALGRGKEGVRSRSGRGHGLQGFGGARVSGGAQDVLGSCFMSSPAGRAASPLAAPAPRRLRGTGAGIGLPTITSRC